jgi:nicastrin
VSVAEASAANPGIPPSSLSSFLRERPAIAGVVLADFDTRYVNRFFESRFDGRGNVDAASVAAAAVVVARALHELALGGGDGGGGSPAPLEVRIPPPPGMTVRCAVWVGRTAWF